MECPTEEPQVLADLKAFPAVSLQQLREEVPRRFANRGGLIHYAVIDNQLFRRTLGKYTDFKMFSDEMLLSLTRKVSSHPGWFCSPHRSLNCAFTPEGEASRRGVLHQCGGLAPRDQDGGRRSRLLLVRFCRDSGHRPPHLRGHTLHPGDPERRHE